MTRSALLVLLTLTAARGDDWPQWAGPQRDGVWRETGIVDKFPAGGPKVEWRNATVGAGYAGPAVANGKVFVPGWVMTPGEKLGGPFSRDQVKGTELVTALDAKTGAKLWQHSYPVAYSISYAAGPRCTPTVDGDRVYALGAMGHLFCLDAASGKPVWAKDFVADYEAKVPVWGFAAHPLVDGDKLICLAGGSDGRLVVALDKLTGKQLWAALSWSGRPSAAPATSATARRRSRRSAASGSSSSGTRRRSSASTRTPARSSGTRRSSRGRR